MVTTLPRGPTSPAAAKSIAALSAINYNVLPGPHVGRRNAPCTPAAATPIAALSGVDHNILPGSHVGRRNAMPLTL